MANNYCVASFTLCDKDNNPAKLVNIELAENLPY